MLSIPWGLTLGPFIPPYIPWPVTPPRLASFAASSPWGTRATGGCDGHQLEDGGR
jgi:hypothetical protein